MTKGKYKIRWYPTGWRVTQVQTHDNHVVEAFIQEFDTHAEACGFVSLELQQDGFPYHTEHYLYNREVCS
jgi:hypothetical protein